MITWLNRKRKEYELRLREEQLFAIAASELKSKQTRLGIWAKAFAEAGGDEKKTEARYIQLRADQLSLAIDAQIELAMKSDHEIVELEPLPPPRPRPLTADAVLRSCINVVSLLGLLFGAVFSLEAANAMGINGWFGIPFAAFWIALTLVMRSALLRRLQPVR